MYKNTQIIYGALLNYMSEHMKFNLFRILICWDNFIFIQPRRTFNFLIFKFDKKNFFPLLKHAPNKTRTPVVMTMKKVYHIRKSLQLETGRNYIR